MILRDLLARNIGSSGDITVTGLTADSRKVQPGFVFVALRGAITDGRVYIPQAIAAGAVAVIGCDLPDMDVVAVEVDEPRLLLAQAAAQFYPGQPEMIVAVTGTNGKSSTVDFLRQIWQRAGFKTASIGTLGAIGSFDSVNLGHTTPDPVAIHTLLDTMAQKGISHAAVEASSHGLAQYRMDAVRLGAVAFTNLTQDHMDYHSDMNAYRAAKLRLFSELAPRGVPAVINADSDQRLMFEAAAEKAGLDVVSVGWRGEDLKICELMPQATGQRLFVNWCGRPVKLDLPLIGEFQALNALMASTLALATGTPLEAVIEGLTELKPVKGRLEYVGETAQGAGVFVDYAHTPAGLDVLIRAARPHTAGRLVLVFGCGGDRDRSKRSMMGAIAAKHADVVIVTDDNPRTEEAARIRAEIMTVIADGIEIADRGEAIRHAIATLRAGDTLLIAGKGHETGQIIGDQRIPFSDQETALVALGETANA